MAVNPSLIYSAVTAIGLAAPLQSAEAQIFTILGFGGSVSGIQAPISVFQIGSSNVIGIAQAGTKTSTIISQAGSYNRAVVVQVGASPAATITQRGGQYNRALVLQVGPDPIATVAQDGPVNTVGIVQSATGVSPLQVERVAQNLLSAPETVGAQAELAQVAARGLGSTLLRHLETSRTDCLTEPRNGTWSADLDRAVPPDRASAKGCRQFSVFSLGSHQWGSRDDRLGVTGYDYYSDSIVIGSEYQAAPGIRIGSAFGYGITQSDLKQDRATIDLDSYQVGLFGSLSHPNWFGDVAITYGGLRLDVRRPGFIAPVTASPGGTTLMAGLNSGYLFDAGVGRAGPIAGLYYAKGRIENQVEQGDPLLAQSVPPQSLDSLVTSVGIRAQLPVQIGAVAINAFAHLTAERELLDQARTGRTGFGLFPGLPILTPMSDTDRTYGRVIGGLNADLGEAASATLVAERTFAREGRDDFSVTAALVARF